MTTEPATAHRRTPARATRLNRDAVVNAALSFLDRAGWDALTINALAVELGTKGPSLYNHVDSLDDLRHEVRDRVLAEIVGMLHTVSSGRSSEDAILAMAGAYRSYAHHHPGRYAALTRMPFLDAVNRPTIDARELAAGDRGHRCLRAERGHGLSRRCRAVGGDARFCDAGDDRIHGRYRDGPRYRVRGDGAPLRLGSGRT